MARSHKPIVWGLFAAGGTFAAFITPVMVLVTGLAVAFGLLPADALAYDRVLGWLQHPIGKLIAFAVIFLPAWHAAHRLRITAHDFGIRADTLVALVCYAAAALATVVAALAILKI